MWKILIAADKEEIRFSGYLDTRLWGKGKRRVCKVRTQDAENFDEEVMSLVTAWWYLLDINSRRTS